MEANYPFDMPGTTKNSVLKERANLAGMFVAVEDGGCAGCLDDVPDYDFTKFHPRYWPTGRCIGWSSIWSTTIIPLFT